MADKLIRMVDGTGRTTEINDSRLGLQVPDKDGAVWVTAECIDAFEKAGFRVQELTQADLLQRVVAAIRELADPLRTALLASVTAEQLRHAQHP